MNILLVAVALLPAIVLCCYVYRKDRVEKEPVGFLLLLLILGALTAIPVVIVSGPVNDLIDGFFGLFARETDDSLYLSTVPYHIYLFISNTVGVGCIEEGFKWLVLFFVTRKSKHFNCYFDGLIYAVFVSLGFAALENVLYTLDYGLSTAVIRAFTAVPGHMFDGVIMGTFYSMWNVKNEASKIERVLVMKGVVKTDNPISGKNDLILSYVLPVLLHGAYDYLCSVSSSFATVLFVALLVLLYITQFRRISQMSKDDADEIGYAISMVCKKHPVIRMLVDSSVQNALPDTEKPLSATPKGVRQTHSFSDFEFMSPQSPVINSLPDNSSNLNSGPVKYIKAYIDDSESSDT